MKTKIKIMISYLQGISLYNTIRLNYRYQKLRGVLKCPILCARGVKIECLTGNIYIRNNRFGGIKIGYGEGIFGRGQKKGIIELKGEIQFRGSAFIGAGSKVCVMEKGTLILGNEFTINGPSTIICKNIIEFGNECLLSWDILIMDTDFHKILSIGERHKENEPVRVGNHVWIGCRCTILKGVEIPSDCIISASSKVVSKLKESNCIYSVNPAKLICKDINWER